MTYREGAGEMLPNFANFPPEEPVFSIPLAGAVEVADPSPSAGLEQESEAAPASPEARVEAFLEANAAVVEAVNEGWRTVKVSQENYKRVVAPKVEGPQTSQLARDARRRRDRYIKNFASTNITFGTMKHTAGLAYDEIRQGWEDQELEGKHSELTAELGKAFNTLLAERMEELADKKDDLPEDMAIFIEQCFTAQSLLVISNAYALFRQDIALSKIQEFMKSGEVAYAFVDKLHSLARTNERDREYPGLLELMATYDAQERGQNMLHEGLKREAPDPGIYAPDFIEELREKPKELTVAVGIMEAAAKLVESNFAYDREDFIRLFAQSTHLWPHELTYRLNGVRDREVELRYQELREALKPFVRQGRMSAAVSERTSNEYTTMRIKSPPAAKGSIPVTEARRPVVKGGAPTVAFARAGQNFEDLVDNMIGDTEKEPIASFGVLTAKGDKAGKRFYFEQVSSLDELYELSNLADYARKHREDASLEPALKKALQDLTTDSDNPAHTKRLQSVAYTLELDNGTTKERNARRLSLANYPGVRRRSVGTATRVIYDVANLSGKPTLIIYGAFHKQDIGDNFSKMPRIR